MFSSFIKIKPKIDNEQDVLVHAREMAQWPLNLKIRMSRKTDFFILDLTLTEFLGYARLRTLMGSKIGLK